MLIIMRLQVKVILQQRRQIATPIFILRTPPATSRSIEPATVFWHDDAQNDIAEEFLAKAVAHYDETDDVFNRAFLQNIFIKPHGNATVLPKLAGSTSNIFQDWNSKYVYLLKRDSKVPPGSYFIGPRMFNQAWRIYDDTHGGFVQIRY